MTKATQQTALVFSLRRVRLNNGGYDSHGRYYGVGMPLYRYEAELPDSWSCYHDFKCSQSHEIERTPKGTPHCPECGALARLEQNDILDEIRAYDREDAKARILAKYPNATFKR